MVFCGIGLLIENKLSGNLETLTKLSEASAPLSRSKLDYGDGRVVRRGGALNTKNAWEFYFKRVMLTPKC